jgi:prepilin-type N-terminal cleavage/methylation domain-containing protein
MKKRGFTLIELLIASVILAVLAAIAIPNYLRSEKRARESEVKTVAHALQMAVEDYKATPGWVGLKPALASELNIVATSYLPNAVQIKRNPFNQAETYGYLGSGLVFGPPNAYGRVGYQFVDQVTQYTISAIGGDLPVIILTLVEGQ